MGRPTKDYWNWNMITIPYNGDHSKTAAINLYLYAETGDSGHHICQTTEYPVPRNQWASKKVTAFHYYIKDPAHAAFVKLKWA